MGTAVAQVADLGPRARRKAMFNRIVNVWKKFSPGVAQAAGKSGMRTIADRKPNGRIP